MTIGDQYFDKVVLALPFDVGGLIDYSPVRKKITASGDAKISNAQSKFGGYSALFDGTGDYLTVETLNNDLDLTSGDFTVECFFYCTALTAGPQDIINKDGVYTLSYPQYNIAITSGGKLTAFAGNGAGVSPSGTAYTGTTTASLNAWHHVALVKSGTTIYLFLDGAIEATGVAPTMYAGGKPLLIGYQTSQPSSAYFRGYIDDLRITKAARYTSNFSVPTVANPLYMAQVQGTVKDANGNFARRLVRAHRKSDGKAVAETLSNPSTGEFTLNCPDQTKHYAVVHDSDAWITYLPFNGDNNSTLFYEWGGKSVTPYGNAKISTTQSKFGGSSLYLDGAGDYLSMDSSVDFNFGTGDFTVEGWVRSSTIGTTQNIFVAWPISGPNGVVVQITSAGKVRFTSGDSDVASWNIDITGATTLSANSWYHIAAVRSGSTFTIYLNGVSDGTGSWSGSIAIPTIPVLIGSNGSADYFNGYIDDLRISKGVARYVANFTPPTAPHFTVQEGDPWWNNVVLGCHFDGQPDNGDTYRNSVVLNMRGNDLTEDTGKVVTAYGNAAVATVSGRAAFGGKAYSFDGAGDYLIVGSSEASILATGGFTLEFWVNQASVTGQQTVFRSGANASGSLFIEAVSGKIAVYTWAPGLVVLLQETAGTVNPNQWYHIAIVRSGNNFTVYRDGVSVATGSSSASLSYAHDIWIGSGLGSGDTHGNYLNGFLDDLRLTKGIARTITVPTAEIPALQRSFPDVASGKVLTANGDVKIVSTQSKFGGYSAYFDGTGDYLLASANSSFNFVGDFTVEFWAYFLSTAGNQCMLEIGDSTNNRTNISLVANIDVFAINGGGGGQILVGASPTANAWHHVAFIGNGASCYLYVDGVLVATAARTYLATGTSLALSIGATISGGSLYTGYIDDLRITKGIARYSANFTPPTAAFSEVLGTYGQQNAMIYDYLTPV